MKRWLIWLHRYLGIPMSVVFVVWFLSGIVMMYTGGMPSLAANDRLEHRGRIDPDAVRLSLGDAAARAGLADDVASARLQALLGRPAYRLNRRDGRAITIFADNGDAFDVATAGQALAEVARFTGVAAQDVRYLRTLDQPDQWTLTESARLPLEHYAVADGRGTEAYFSRRSGEVELLTSRGSRVLAWAGAVPHWFYFTPLRQQQAVWYWTVVWFAAAGCVLAVLGIVLAWTQFRRTRPFSWSAAIRYRGWMRWHYVSGAIFGVFALTWVFSGLLSMEPFAWTRASGLALPPAATGDVTLDPRRYDFDFARLAPAMGCNDPCEMEFADLAGVPALIVSSVASAARRVFDLNRLAERTEALPVQSLLERIERSDIDARVLAYAVLEDYDAYYYDRARQAPLPVLQVRFDDPAATWYYFDLLTGQPVFANHRLSRIERWLFNGLHSLDFSFWYARRPFWDVGMLLLLGGALTTSSIGLCLGYRRMLNSVTANMRKNLRDN